MFIFLIYSSLVWISNQRDHVLTYTDNSFKVASPMREFLVCTLDFIDPRVDWADGAN